jgi:anti-sigma factor RsiW
VIPYLGCDAAQELLQAFVDGELQVAEQVAVESHLRWCRVCSTRVEDMQIIGASLRVTSCAMRAADSADDNLASVQSAVLTRIRTEREQSLGSQLRDMCADMRFFWPAVGASLAAVACLCVAAAGFSVSSDERPDSLAGMIQMLANPGSDQNPMRLDGGMTAPPRALNGAALDSIPGDEAVFALAAVVTREGRVANYEVLMSERASVRRHDAAVQTDDVSSVLNAVKQSRFAPAQGTDGAPIAVNMVWVLARTTVTAPAQTKVELRPLPVRLAPTPPAADVVPKPDADAPSTSLSIDPSTTA